ncbi:MAG: Lrp/AsnC family transcriptional regulator [Candidatus Omnitrophica bacterium]|nr:Lrp/AsnC family transcriptional regulator [Candidatus Omnitrophota bacterium]
MRLSTIDRKILNCIQEDIPFEPEPFKILSRRIGIKEEALLKSLKRLRTKGIIHSFSARLNHRKLKFRSTLLGIRVPKGKLKPLVKKITGYPEVTHCYLRQGKYNLWCVFLYKNGRLQKLMRELSKEVGSKNILNLTTKKKFKLKTRLEI